MTAHHRPDLLHIALGQIAALNDHIKRLERVIKEQALAPRVTPKELSNVTARLAILERARNESAAKREGDPGPEPKRSIKDLIAQASIMFEVTPVEIKGRNRVMGIVHPRQWVMFEARKLGYTLEQIAWALGRRNHTTVMDGIKREAERRKVQEE